MRSPTVCVRGEYLLEQIPDPNHTADDETDQILGVKLIVDDLWMDRQTDRQ